MISTTNFHSGLTFLIEGQPYQIVEFQHVKPGKGGAFVRSKLRRVKDGAVLERTFRAGDKFQEAYIERRTLQYLYRAGDVFHLMDTQSYEQLEMPAGRIGEMAGFLKENAQLEGQYLDGELIGLQPPTFVDVHVEWTEPGVRGDTSKSAMKPAKLETGATVQVPLFVKTGDLIRVDTRTGSYVSRV